MIKLTIFLYYTPLTKGIERIFIHLQNPQYILYTKLPSTSATLGEKATISTALVLVKNGMKIVQT